MVKELSSLGFNQSSSGGEAAFKDVLGWLSLQPHLILRNIDLHYTGFKQEARFLTLYDLSFENTTNTHHIEGKAILHQDLPTEVTLSAEWHGQTLDLNQIKARAYLYTSGLSLSQWAKGLSWKDWQVKEGVASAKIWVVWQDGALQKIQSTMQLYGLKLFSQQDKSTHVINRLSGNVGWKRQGLEQILAGDEILLDLPGHLWPVTNFRVSLLPDSKGVLAPKTANIGYVDLSDVQSFLLAAKAQLPTTLASALSELKLSGGLQQSTMVFAESWDDWNQLTLHAVSINLVLRRGDLFQACKT